LVCILLFFFLCAFALTHQAARGSGAHDEGDQVGEVKTFQRPIRNKSCGASGLALSGKIHTNLQVPMLGFLCDSPTFVPQRLDGLKSHAAMLGDDEVQTLAQQLFRHVPCSFMMSKVCEKDVDDNAFASFLTDEAHHVGILSRQVAILDSVFATSNQIDFLNYIEVANIKVGLFTGDFKASSHVPLDAMGQSFDSGTAACHSQFAVGIPLNECICPLVLTTGKLQQHAAVYMLSPNTPCVAFLSPVLDLSTLHGCTESAKYWTSSLAHARKMKSRVEEQSAVRKVKLNKEMVELNCQLFFVKQASGLRFIRPESEVHHRQNLLMLLHRFGQLWKGGDEVRDAVAFPVTTFGWAGSKIHGNCAPHLVFDNYTHEANGSFQALAECKLTKTQYMVVLRAVAAALSAIHAAGVVHMDLTPGNILCTTTEAGVCVVKLVDWDTSLLAGEKIPTGTAGVLAHNGWSTCYHPSMADGQCALADFDWWFICMMAKRVENIDANEVISAEDKNNDTLVFIRDNQQEGDPVDVVRNEAEGVGSSYELVARNMLQISDR
jgi:hypothetical protein